MDVRGRLFQKITESALALVDPSCSEGASMAVVTCLHAGLVSPVSYESGVDIGTSGTLLTTCSIAEIQDAIVRLAEKPVSQQKEHAREA